MSLSPSTRSSRPVSSGTHRTGEPTAVYLEALGAGSRRTIRQALATLAALLGGQEEADPHRFDWASVDAAAVARLRVQLAERYAPSTANKMLAALRGVLRVCRDQGRLSEARFQAVTRFDPIKDFRPAESRVLSESELKRLLAGCVAEGTAAGRRDAALVVIFLTCGLRREEAIELNREDYAPPPPSPPDSDSPSDMPPDMGTLHVRSAVPERDRLVTLGPEACAAIDHWLEARGDEPGPLLLPVDKGGTIRFRRLTSQAVYGIVSRAATRVRLPHTTTRDLRRTCIVRLIRAGLDLSQVRQRVGHASWLTTAAYRLLADEARKLPSPALPYRRPEAIRGSITTSTLPPRSRHPTPRKE